MYVFQPYIHRPNLYAQVLEAGEEVEEVVRSERELRRLYRLRGEGEGGKGEGCRPDARGRGCGSICGSRRRRGRNGGALAMSRCLPLQLQRIRKRFLVGTYKVR